MWYKRNKNASGDYVGEAGERFDLFSLYFIPAAEKSEWTHFDTPEECLKTWGLTYDPLPEPEPEN